MERLYIVVRVPKYWPLGSGLGNYDLRIVIFKMIIL